MTRVYLACPYSIGDKDQNVRNAIDAADELMRNGFAVFNPLLSHYHNEFHPRDYESWMAQDMEWLSVCDCVLRIPGFSLGADRECARAAEILRPVYYSIDELIVSYG